MLRRDPGTGLLSDPACLTDGGTPGCGEARAIGNPEGIAISPDGMHVYVAGFARDAVAVFDRDAATGALTQKTGTAGCIAEDPALDGCTDGHHLQGVRHLALSPDGRHLYVASAGSDAVAVLARASDGTLSQDAGPGGCVSKLGVGCRDGHVLDGPYDIAVAPHGTAVYVTTTNDLSLVMLSRDADGALTQVAAPSGCFEPAGEDGCTQISDLGTPWAVAVHPGSAHVYVAAGGGDDRIRVFDGSDDGLAIRPPPWGCVAVGGVGGCASGRELGEPYGLAVSEDRHSLYVASRDADSVTVYDLDDDGTPTPELDENGCVTLVLRPACVTAVGLDAPFALAVSADGDNVYAAAADTDALVTFLRMQPPPPGPCDDDCAAGGGSALAPGRVVARFRVRGRRTVVRRLEVRGLRRGSRVRIFCRARRKGCPALPRRRLRATRSRIVLTGRFRGDVLRPGAVVELRITARGRTGAVTRLLVRRARQPRRVSLCLPAGASRPVRC